jgi:hypothetical protein
MSSRRRAVVEFPIEYNIFVNQKSHLSITGFNQYCIRTASEMMGMRG